MTTTYQAPDLTVTVENASDHTIVIVSGEIDVATAPRLRAYLDGVTILRRGSLHLDMSGVTFMDSTGLGVLIGTARHLSSADAELVLRAPTARVLRVLAVSGVGRFFTVTG